LKIPSHRSALFEHGVLGHAIENSVQGRYLRAVESAFLQAVRRPNPAQRLLIANAAQLAWQLRELEKGMLRPNGSVPVDTIRVYKQVHNQFLSIWRELLGRPSARGPDDPVSVGAALASLRQAAFDGSSVDGDRYPAHVDADPPADTSEVPPPHGDAAPVDGRASRGAEPP
jgi:hypothetical protein